MKRVGWLLWAVASACSSSTPSDTRGANPIRAVCAPTATQSDVQFQLRVMGGCVSGADSYACEVVKSSSSVDIRLIGPSVCDDCSCVTVDKACVVPALPEGTWSFTFAEGTSFNRDVHVSPNEAVFSCARDGGMAADGG